ncbi:MAG: ABC transporter permease [Defluviitaleaceae bacterium]|nr:ABC transporter permease [Defluviitaleaceae bacterium]
MVKYVIRRLFYIALVLFLVSFFIFMLFRTMPGDPIELYLPLEMQSGLSPEQLRLMKNEIIETMGLDRNHFVQYFYWVASMARGDFGISMETRQSVLDHVRSPMANTITMNVFSMFLVFAITIPVGVYSALRRGRLFDNTALVGSMIGLSIPGFLFGLIMIVLFAIIFPVFPMFGMASIMPPDEGTLAWYQDRLRYMALPLLSIVFMGLAGMIRFIRSAMIDALNMDCIRTARAKGLAEKTVIYVHAFRNALIPIITVMAGFFIGIFGGSMAIEITFSWQGMGQIMLNALNLRDISVLMAMNVFYALIAFTGLLALDIVYVMVDPRIRFD